MDTIKLKLASGIGVFNDPISDFTIANKQIVEVEEGFGETILNRCKGITKAPKDAIVTDKYGITETPAKEKVK